MYVARAAEHAANVGELAGLDAGNRVVPGERVIHREPHVRLAAAVPHVAEHDARDGLGGVRGLTTKNGRKNVRSARYRPILSANRTRQRPTHACIYLSV